jgi:hypothetical protein
MLIKKMIIIITEFAVSFLAEMTVENRLFEPAEAADPEPVDREHQHLLETQK